MTRFIRIAVAITVVAGANPASAQQSQAAADAARQQSVVQQAMRTYQEGLDDLRTTESLVQPGTSSGALRELRLEEAVSLALEKNLDIQVAKLEPQSVDFLIAGFRNQYQPVMASTVGQRDNYQLPTRTIN